MKYKVGQVWECRDGYKATITEIDMEMSYPVIARNTSYTPNGTAWKSRESQTDLMHLITDVPDTVHQDTAWDKDLEEVVGPVSIAYNCQDFVDYHMTKDEYMEHLDETFASIKTLVSGKIDDYCGDGTVFANYNNSTKAGVDPVVGVILRMNDKIERLNNFSKSGKLVNESAEDALKDMIGYSLSVLGMMRSKK